MEVKSKESSKLWDQSFWSKQEPPSFTKLGDLNNPLDLSILPIPKLKNPNIHYRCPKCYNFPFIQFLKNKEDIIYTCACIKNKYLKIRDLFIPENKYITSLNDKENMNQILGFKCLVINLIKTKNLNISVFHVEIISVRIAFNII